MKRNIYIIHPFRQHNFEQASELKKLFGNRVKLITSFYIPQILLKLLFKRKLILKLKNRSIPNFNFWNYTSFPVLFLKYKLGWISTDVYRKKFIRKAAKKIKSQSIIIGYDSSSMHIFNTFKRDSILILDFTIALESYSNVVNPKSYNNRVGINHDFINGEYFQSKLSEINLADKILVGSKFVHDSIIHFYPHFEKKIEILPYGFDANLWKNLSIRNFNSPKLNLLFVGTASFRKGFHCILEMIRQNPRFFDYFNLTICGNIDVEFRDDLQLIPEIKQKGFLSHELLSDEMNDAHVLMLPSYLEGSAITVYQAMATGLTCIVTEHTGSIITNKVNGMICKVGDSGSIYEQLEWLLNNRNKLSEISKEAQKSIQGFTWHSYGENLSKIIKNQEITNRFE